MNRSSENISEKYNLNHLIIKNSLDIKSDVSKAMKENNFCIIKGFLTPDESAKVLEILKKRFQPNRDISISGDFYYMMDDYQRLDIGDHFKNPRIARFIIFNEWISRNVHLYKIINKIINFRNKITNYKKEKYFYPNISKSDYFFCDLVRMIQYPVGGGFLLEHNDKDEFYPQDMINILMPLTKKGESSFQSGGLYYVINKQKIYIEDYIEPGDLILHNQSINHGVSSIDPQKKLNLDSLNGRITLNFSIGKFIKKLIN